jgi:hypothetical protein
MATKEELIEFTGDYFKKIKEFYQWLKVKLQLEE